VGTHTISIRFGLKSGCDKDQVGRNILSYVDDILVVSKKKTTYISDLAETFASMCEARLKLNPEKFVFGVT
jgi:hypothetical protein